MTKKYKFVTGNCFVMSRDVKLFDFVL